MEAFLRKYLPENISTQGHQVDNLIIWVHWLMLILGVGWTIYFVYTLWRFRASANPKADPVGIKGHFSSYLEVAVAVFELVLLFGISIPFWSNVVSALPNEEEAITIRIVAEQFAWNSHYPGLDGKLGRTDFKLMDPSSNPLGLDKEDPNAKDDFYTVNDLVVPVNKKVIVKITSKDVIHSFALQEARVKQDAIPGQEIPQWFEITKTGKWEISCAQLCGIGHAGMRGDFTVLEQGEYDSWVNTKVQEAASEGDSW